MRSYTQEELRLMEEERKTRILEYKNSPIYRDVQQAIEAFEWELKDITTIKKPTNAERGEIVLARQDALELVNRLKQLLSIQ